MEWLSDRDNDGKDTLDDVLVINSQLSVLWVQLCFRDQKYALDDVVVIN